MSHDYTHSPGKEQSVTVSYATEMWPKHRLVIDFEAYERVRRLADDAIADCQRWIARNKKLEARLQAVREVVQ